MTPRALALLACLAFAPLSLFSACPGPGGSGGPGVLPPQTCEQNPNQPQCLDTVGDGTGTPDTVTPDTVTPDTPGPDGGCQAQCSGKTCGPDGCGGFCGTCSGGLTCVDGGCIEGECGQGGATVTGMFNVGPGVEFDKVTVAVTHKMDIDEFEDGCLTTVVIDLGKGFGCTLHIEAGTATWPTGGLRITNLEFLADSQCPGFPDDSEGEYVDFSGLTLHAVIPSADKVPDNNAPNSCLTANLQVRLEGVIKDVGTKLLNVVDTTINIGGEFASTGSTTASCPCEASCSGKQCGDDGCGFDCGTCETNETCDGAGICQCTPDCTDKICGDDGCGGSCGDCGAFEACSTDGNECVPCVPECTGKACGDNGCGGSCGDCGTNEACNGTGQCECPNTDCSGECCDSGQVCDGASACCAPDCSGKDCGDDGCGGSCGTCAGANNVCNAGTGLCECTPDCTGKNCGDDGCGGSCGTCTGTDTCNTVGQCIPCSPQCSGKDCGADGCGGSCGTCTSPQTCNAGTGVCEGGTTTCTASPFAPIGVVASQAGNAGSEFVVAEWYDTNDPANAASFELMQFEFLFTSAGTLPTAFDLSTWDNYSNCQVCVLLRTGCNATSGTCDKLFFPISGGVQLDAYSSQVGQDIDFFIADVEFEEVTVDFDTFISTPVPGGDHLCITGGMGVGPMTVVAP